MRIPAIDRVVTVSGSVHGFANGGRFSAEFNRPYSICLDPIRPTTSYYLGDSSSIRFCTRETVSLIAGSESCGVKDGIGGDARLDTVSARDGNRLYVADSGNSLIRMVDLATLAVTTIAGDGGRRSADGSGLKCSIYNPRRLAFDRSATALYITSAFSIRRFDLTTKEMTTVEWNAKPAPRRIVPYAIGVLPNDQLIASCITSHSMYLLDPKTGEHEVLDDPKSDRFALPYDLAVVESERSIYIVDHGNNTLRRMTLAPSVFETTKAGGQPAKPNA